MPFIPRIGSRSGVVTMLGRVHGFTIIELSVTLLIVGLLATVALLAYKPLIARAENARCLSNMRSLHTALNSYIQDKGHWPQEPKELWEQGNTDALEDWWIAVLEPYGVTVTSWRCPTIFRALQESDPKQRPKAHYMPSKFDHLALSPYRWNTQPWLVEIGDMHGNGGNICFPDGSIRQLNDFLPAAPK